MRVNNAIERLKKILKLEQQQGCRNKAVIGGLARMADRWQIDAAKEVTLDGQMALIRQIVAHLHGYGDLSGAPARKEAIENMLALAGQWDAPPAVDYPAAAPAVAPQPAPAPAAAPAPVPQPALAPPAAPGPGPQPARAPAANPPWNAAAPPAAPTAPPAELAKPIPAPPRAPAQAARPAPQPSGPAYAHVRPTPVGTASLSASINRLPGIGPTFSERLGKIGIRTIGDLLWLLPRRYDDYSAMKPIHQLRDGDEVTILANLWDLKSKRLPGRGATIVTGLLGDSTATIQVSWFSPYVLKQLKTGQHYVFSGKVQSYMGRLTMRSPEFEEPDKELLHTGRLVPVYPLTKGISAKWMRNTQKKVVVEWGRRVHDYLPESVRQRAGLVTLAQALEQVHFPDDQASLRAARQRLAFDELFVIQIGVLRQRQEYRSLAAQRFPLDGAGQAAFAEALPFAFTGAQVRAARAILDDLAGEQPMSRLLQGDVGSGKTAVAANAMWAVAANGAQAAMMAPTEILAEQHYRGLSRLFEPLAVQERPVRVALLTGSVKGAERAATLRGLAAGDIDIAVGTQALIQEGVEFRNLGLAIIDEQHRFGVRQRAMLRGKALPGDGAEAQELPAPHLLVMTATPIPRTLSLTVFGDLDASVIDEMPPGRQPIKTRWMLSRERERAYSFIRRQVEAGRQAFIIYPLVEESESLSAKAAVPEYQQLCQEVFPQLRLGLLHGRMKSAEKDAVMQAMQRGEIDILVATSVVEVGIDVPNATVILIEDAERFGLAQLHQFRGRVGRGEHASYCILISDATTPNAAERLHALEQSQDGFVLAEKDLQLRGPGDFFGTRQSGLPDLKMAQLSDLRTLETARDEAGRLLQIDPDLAMPEHTALARKARQFWRGDGDVS
jgi:ATP-dependent DNA helicase RecG